MKRLPVFILIMGWVMSVPTELALCPLAWGEGVPRPAFSSAGAPHHPVQGGARRVRGHFGPTSQKMNLPKQLPNRRQGFPAGNPVNLGQPGLSKLAAGAKSGFVRNETVNNHWTPSVVRPTAQSFNNVRHHSPNLAVVGGPAKTQADGTGSVNGTRMNRRR